MTLYRAFRRRLCNSILAMHELDEIQIAYGFDICRCKFCNRFYAVDTYRHIVHDLELDHDHA